MCTLRVVILFIGLALCVCATARNGTSKNVGASKSAWSNPGSVQDHRSRFVLMLEMVQDAETGDGELAQNTADLESKHQHQTKSGDQILEIFPRDLRRKEKFLKNLTGPLYFSSKCRKDVYRLYHNTRDCTIPAYYKRCARLLTRLAGNPRCLES